MRKLIYIFILSCLATLVQAQQMVTVPELEGGFTASIGTFYATPSTNNNNFATGFQSGTIDSHTNNQSNQFGTQGSIGYIFDNSSNGIEVSNRRLN